MESSLHPISKAALLDLKHSPRKRGFEPLHSVEKFLMAFLDGQGIFLLKFLDHGAAVNAYHYCTILWHLEEAVWMELPGLITEKVIP
jgi:hypothetical protein